jgi:hypothetical protein
MLERIWPRGHKAGELENLPGATVERVSWLVWRCANDRPAVQRKQGFIERGIREAWDIDAAWLARWHAERERLGGAA